MKIALVSHKYSLSKGGLEKDTVLLSRELLKSGHEVHIFANRCEDTVQGITFHHVPMLHISSPGKNLSFALSAKQKLAGNDFDIIQSMDRILHQDIFRVSDGINPVQMMYRYPNPLLRRIVAATPRRMALKWLEDKIFLQGGTRMVLAISQMIKQEIITHYGMEQERIAVIYSGIDTSVFHPGVKDKYRKSIRDMYGIREDEILLLFISNDHKRKNLAAVLEAMRLLEDKKYRLMVVGSGSIGPYQKKAVKYGIERQVGFLGHRPQIERYFGAADIFVFPSHYDAFGNVCLEAMACGLPVIVSNTCGAAELIQNGKDGFVPEKNRPAQIAEIIYRLEDTYLRSEIGDHAAVTAAQYTLERYMAELLKLYEHVIHMKSGVGEALTGPSF
ncbi:MAG: glycosyltransferase family 4 protein [Desulfococcaceae bacterium]